MAVASEADELEELLGVGVGLDGELADEADVGELGRERLTGLAQEAEGALYAPVRGRGRDEAADALAIVCAGGHRLSRWR